jgi:hypothetical protein
VSLTWHESLTPVLFYGFAGDRRKDTSRFRRRSSSEQSRGAAIRHSGAARRAEKQSPTRPLSPSPRAFGSGPARLAGEPADFNFDANYYYYDTISELKLPTVNRADVGLSTNRISGFMFSIWGRNLQSAHYLENNTGEPYFPAAEVRRALVLELTWRSNPE